MNKTMRRLVSIVVCFGVVYLLTAFAIGDINLMNAEQTARIIAIACALFLAMMVDCEHL